MPIAIPVLGAVSYEPIKAVRIAGAGSASPSGRRMPEAAGLSTQIGVPMKLDGSGNLVECAFSGADVVFGVSQEPGHNLTVAAQPQAGLSEYTPPNQPKGLIIPVGSHIRDGNLGVYIADGNNVFSIAAKITTPNVAGATGLSQVFTENLIQPGVFYGLVKDTTGFAAQGIGASNFWYIDFTVTNGNNAVALLIGVDPSSPNDGVNGCRVFFQFKSSQRFFL